jgi:hypothetical protein
MYARRYTEFRECTTWYLHELQLTKAKPKRLVRECPKVCASHLGHIFNLAASRTTTPGAEVIVMQPPYKYSAKASRHREAVPAGQFRVTD